MEYVRIMLGSFYRRSIKTKKFVAAVLLERERRKTKATVSSANTPPIHRMGYLSRPVKLTY